MKEFLKKLINLKEISKDMNKTVKENKLYFLGYSEAIEDVISLANELDLE